MPTTKNRHIYIQYSYIMIMNNNHHNDLIKNVFYKFIASASYSQTNLLFVIAFFNASICPIIIFIIIYIIYYLTIQYFLSDCILYIHIYNLEN